jgi:hypothetical protein
MLTIHIFTSPYPIISGPATVYALSTTQYCTPFYPNRIWDWTVTGGTVVSGQGTNCITVEWGEYPLCGCGEVTVCETDLATGCTGCATLDITMMPTDANITGYVYYDNAYNTALNGVTIYLYDPVIGGLIATTTTGPNLSGPNPTGDPGYYSFSGIADGTYRLFGSFNGTWGGNNATDALIIQLRSVGLWPLYWLRDTVADVNLTYTVTALDALLVKLRTVGMINSYARGDWEVTDTTFPLVTSAQVDLDALCVGDVNGSYIPTGLKDVSYLTANEGETMTIPVNTSFTYNIYSSSVAELGAMTLFMSYDESLFEIERVNTSLDEMYYVIESGRLAMAWSDPKSMSVNGEEPILSLQIRAKESVSQPTQIFTILPGSEFADAQAIRYDNFNLKLNSVVTGTNEFAIYNYPNPFKNTTTVVYTIPEDGQVTLVLTDMYGKSIKTLVSNFQETGTYSVVVDPIELNMKAGVYMYNITVEGTGNTHVKVGKMVLTR